MSRHSRAALIVAATVPLLIVACWHAADDTLSGERLDPQLRRVLAERPDSVVDVLIRTSAAPTPAQLSAIAATGIVVGSVVDTVVTGRGRARAAARLAELSFVLHVQLAATLRPTDP